MDDQDQDRNTESPDAKKYPFILIVAATDRRGVIKFDHFQCREVDSTQMRLKGHKVLYKVFPTGKGWSKQNFYYFALTPQFIKMATDDLDLKIKELEEEADAKTPRIIQPERSLIITG